MARTLAITAITLAVYLASAHPAFGQLVYKDTPLLQIIRDLQEQTSYRFLYREAQVSNIKLTLQSESKSESDEMIREIRSLLQQHRIAMRVDTVRQQVLLYRTGSPENTSGRSLSGYVVDASSGERLPFATLQWNHDGNPGGTVANSAGYFSIASLPEVPLQLTARYIGYRDAAALIGEELASTPQEVTIRLSREAIDEKEIVITGQNFYDTRSNTLRNYINAGSFSPFGETNTIRALQQLPSVGMTTAMSDGIHVRGSAADGFHVMLDGTSIFNKSHLFGLLDSFNSDVLKRSGLFYDIAPAQYQAPPGGTLSLLTKSGSLNSVRARAGFSNTSYRATLEGPIRKGKSSWMVSGRHSYLNQLAWLNSSNLVKWGLDIERPRQLLDPNLEDVEAHLVTPGGYRARFFDLHSKLYFEGTGGGRFYLTGYLGADAANQQAERLIRSFEDADSGGLTPIDTETSHNWYNIAGSAHYEAPLTPSFYSHTMAGLSIYETAYDKQDFTYVQFGEVDQLIQAFIYPFANRSILNELKARQQFDLDAALFLWSVGGSYSYYLGEYFENSFDRPRFFSHSSSHMGEAFSQFDFNRWDLVHLNLGGRVQYYSNGSFLRFSPRAKLRVLPEQPVSLSLGYSKNFKYLHQVNLYNVVSADVWVLSKAGQPPSEADYLSAGLYLKPWSFLTFQAEAYLKEFQNLRLHEINTQSLTNTFADAPWYYNNDGRGRGLELLLRNAFSGFTLTQAFTWSRMELENSRIRQGEPFPVAWDRTYRYSVTAEATLLEHFHLYLSWIYATGTPNQLATFGPDTIQRLEDYYRTDLSLEYRGKTGFGNLDLSVSLFNLFDRQNPWYRDYSFVIDRTQPRERLKTIPVTVFDLGIQPSFKISARF